MVCPKSGRGKACAVELSCSQDTALCPQEIIVRHCLFFLFVFVTAIGDNVKCDTAIVHNLM